MNLDISDYKVLSDKQTRELIKKYRETKDKEIRNYIVLCNVRLVLKIVNKFMNLEDVVYSFDDFFQVGIIALFKAVETFDLNVKTAWSTYSVRCIQNEILMLTRTATRRKEKYPELSLQSEIKNKKGDKFQIVNTLYSDDNIEKEIELKLNIEKMLDLIPKVLDEREQKIIILRYKEELTQANAAKMLNMGRSWLSRIEKRAMKKIMDNWDK